MSMSPQTVSLIIGILTFIVGVASLIISRRKIAAEVREIKARSASEEIDTTSKIANLIQDMRNDNVSLIKRNLELEKSDSDKTRTLEILTARLETRDSQLAACASQLEHLRNLAKDAPIIETLRAQLEATNVIVSNFQNAQAEMQRLLLEREKSMGELLKTNRNLDLQKTGQGGS